MKPLHPILEHPSLRDALIKVAGLGVISAMAGYFASPEKIWASLLLAGFFILSVSLGAAVFLAIQVVTSSRWSQKLWPIMEALSLGLWTGIMLVALAVGLGAGSLYVWTHQGGHLPHSQEIWLSQPFQRVRLVIYSVLWIGLIRSMVSKARKLRLASKDLGELKAFSAFFLVAFAISFSAASMDWVMALEPHWFSTIFGLYLFSGAFLSAMATMAVILAVSQHPDHSLNHDLGKLIFGFSSFWAYIWFCQYLLIWYTNIPEEVGFFSKRLAGDWWVLMVLNVFLNWLVPFFALMRKKSKESSKTLFRVGVCILFGHWLDLFIIMMPVFAPQGFGISAWEIGLFLGAVGFFGWSVLGAANFKKPLEL